MSGHIFAGLLILFFATMVAGFSPRFGSLHSNYSNSLMVQQIFLLSFPIQPRLRTAPFANLFAPR